MSLRRRILFGALSFFLGLVVLYAAWPPKKLLYTVPNWVRVLSQDENASISIHSSSYFGDSYVKFNGGQDRKWGRRAGFSDYPVDDYPLFVDNAANHAVGVKQPPDYILEGGRAEITVSLLSAEARPFQKDITVLMQKYIDPLYDNRPYETQGWLGENVYAFSDDVRPDATDAGAGESVFVVWVSRINRCFAFDLDHRQELVSSAERQEEWGEVIRAACDKGFRRDWRPSFRNWVQGGDGPTRCTYFYMRNPETDAAEYLHERFTRPELEKNPRFLNKRYPLKRFVVPFDGDIAINEEEGKGSERRTFSAVPAVNHEFRIDVTRYDVKDYEMLDFGLGLLAGELDPGLPKRNAISAWHAQAPVPVSGALFLGGAFMMLSFRPPESFPGGILSFCLILDEPEGPWSPRTEEGECTYHAQLVSRPSDIPDATAKFKRQRLRKFKLLVQGLVPGKYRIEASLHAQPVEGDIVPHPRSSPGAKSEAIQVGESPRIRVVPGRITAGIMVELEEVDGG